MCLNRVEQIPTQNFIIGVNFQQGHFSTGAIDNDNWVQVIRDMKKIQAVKK